MNDQNQNFKHNGFKVIALVSRKGGTGKSSTAINLAQALRIHAKNVALIDADEQRSILDWEEISKASNRQAKYGVYFPDVISADNAIDLRNILNVLDNDEEAQGHYQYVIIDLAGHLTQLREGGIIAELFEEVIRQSDMMIMVNNPDMFCVKANTKGTELINELIENMGENLICRSLMNNVPTRLDSGARNSMRELKELAEAGKVWPFFDAVIPYSRRVASTLTEGGTSFIPMLEKCADNYNELMREVLDSLGERSRNLRNLKDIKKRINGYVSSSNLTPAVSNK